jgi:cytochrome c2
VDFGDRRLIAGRIPNTLPNLLRWLENPQAVEPGTVMPDLGIEAPQARDLAAYLYAH